MIDREALIAHYRRMPDETFTHFATHDAEHLEPEAAEILVQELALRGTVRNPRAAVDVQRRQLSSHEFSRMVDRLRREPCPLCGHIWRLLEAARMFEAAGADLVLGCPPCLKVRVREAKERSGFGMLASLGFLVSVAHHDAALRELEGPGPTRALIEYVWYHRGQLAHLLD